MRKYLKNWGKKVSTCFLQAMTIVFLLSAFVGHAQSATGGCIPVNNVPFGDMSVGLYSDAWVQGQTVTAYLDGTYPVGGVSGCNNVNVSAWEWEDVTPNNMDCTTDYGPDYEYYCHIGPSDPYVELSNLTYVSPTVTTFTVSVAGDAPPGPVFIVLRSSTTGVQYFAYWVFSIQARTPPNPPYPLPPQACPTPAFASENPVSPDTWFAGKEYPIVITGTGFTTPANATDSCPATQITVSVDTGSVKLSDVVVLNSTTITAMVKPADTDPAETAEVNLWGPPSGPIGGVVRVAGKATRTASSPKAMAIPPVGPNGMVLYDQRPAQVANLKAVITDTSNIMNGIVTVKLTAPSSTKGDLNLDFNGADANGLELSQVPFTALAPGSQNLKLPFDKTILPGIYPMANGTWDATVPSVAEVQSVTVPDYTLPTPWTYFRKVRFTQYNVPHESACTGDEVKAWTIDDNCNFNQIWLQSDFVDAAWLNGTGITRSNVILKNAAAVYPGLGSKQARCKSTQFGGKVKWPVGAQGYSPGNTFEVVNAVTGSCSISLNNHQSAAMPVDPDTMDSVMLSGVMALSCKDRIVLDKETYTTAYTETVADKCKACSNPKTFTGGADGHVDSYTSNPACHTGPGTIGDLGYFYTSYPTK